MNKITNRITECNQESISHPKLQKYWLSDTNTCMILLDTYQRNVLQNFKRISTNTFWVPYWYFEYISKNM